MLIYKITNEENSAVSVNLILVLELPHLGIQSSATSSTKTWPLFPLLSTPLATLVLSSITSFQIAIPRCCLHFPQHNQMQVQCIQESRPTPAQKESSPSLTIIGKIHILATSLATLISPTPTNYMLQNLGLCLIKVILRVEIIPTMC